MQGEHVVQGVHWAQGVQGECVVQGVHGAQGCRVYIGYIGYKDTGVQGCLGYRAFMW